MRKISKLSLLAAASFILAACGANRPDGQTSKWGWAEWPSNTPASSQPSSAPASTSESSWDYIPPSEAPSSEAPSSKPSSKPSSSKSSAPKNDWKDEDAPWATEFPVGGNDGQGGLAPVTGGGSSEMTYHTVAQEIYQTIFVEMLGETDSLEDYEATLGVDPEAEGLYYMYIGLSQGGTESDQNNVNAIATLKQFMPEYLTQTDEYYRTSAGITSFLYDDNETVAVRLEGNFSNNIQWCDIYVMPYATYAAMVGK